MENNKLIDMHIHTINSDGEYTVEEIMRRIKENNIKTFSITDHDDIGSISQIEKINLNNLEFYNGVEISSEYGSIGMHVLGYDFNQTLELKDLINNIQENRKRRCLELIEMLSWKYGITITDNLIEEILKHKVVGKPHIVEALYRLGYGKNNDEIYNNYLNKSTVKTKYRTDIKKVIKVIKDANGIVIIAHPKEIEKRYHVDFTDLLKELVELGIDGIEVYNSIHSLDDIIRYQKLALENNLLISGGSDYHGPFVKPDVILGGVSREKNNIKELSLVNKLRRRNMK